MGVSSLSRRDSKALQDHQSLGSQTRVGTVPIVLTEQLFRARTVPELKSSLNWPQILKFTAGNSGDVCGNLGRFSLRKPATLLCFS